MSLLKDIEKDTLSSTDLSTVLRKAKVLAYHLKNEEFKQWVEHELNGYGSDDVIPDYRTINTVSHGNFISLAWKAYDAPIPTANLPQFMQEINTVDLRQGIKELESLQGTLRNSKADSLTVPWPADLLPVLNNRVFINMNCVGAWRVVTMGHITAIIENTRNRLLTFALELAERYPEQAAADFDLASPPIPQEQLRRVVNYYIMGNATTIQTGGIMTTFDQRHQKVNYQYNAAGDINLENVTNRVDLVGELKKLKTELGRARDADAIDAEIVTDAEYQIAKAIHEAEKPSPDKKTLLDYVDNAKKLLTGVGAVAGLAAGLAKVAELIGQLF